MTTNGDVLIRVENLQKAFGDFHALNGITEEIHKGEVVVIIGPSGSGKSTFLRSLNLLEVPTGGHIYFEGVDITDAKVDIDKHRQKMGMVFQHFNLFHIRRFLKISHWLRSSSLKRIKQRQKKKQEYFLRGLDWKRRQILIRHSFPVDRSSGSRSCVPC